jgi:arylsulfatase
MPEAVIAATEPYIWESDASGTMKKARPYTVDNRGQVEGEIAKASVDLRTRQNQTAFFLYVGFTQTHYPIRTAPEFVGKSRIGPYGDAIIELDYRTGQILDAIKSAGVEDNTIVIWISDNAAAPTAGPSDTRFGFNGPFRGELGDALEGSIRTVGMIKWPGKIAPRATNEMFAVHDWFPTLASIIGAKVPADRPIDGMDQSAFITGKQRVQPQQSPQRRGRRGALSNTGSARKFTMTTQSADGRSRWPSPGNASCDLNIDADVREEANIVGTSAWVIGPYLKLVSDYYKTLEKYPIPSR